MPVVGVALLSSPGCTVSFRPHVVGQEVGGSGQWLSLSAQSSALTVVGQSDFDPFRGTLWRLRPVSSVGGTVEAKGWPSPPGEAVWGYVPTCSLVSGALGEVRPRADTFISEQEISWNDARPELGGWGQGPASPLSLSPCPLETLLGAPCAPAILL